MCLDIIEIRLLDSVNYVMLTVAIVRSFKFVLLVNIIFIYMGMNVKLSVNKDILELKINAIHVMILALHALLLKFVLNA